MGTLGQGGAVSVGRSTVKGAGQSGGTLLRERSLVRLQCGVGELGRCSPVCRQEGGMPALTCRSRGVPAHGCNPMLNRTAIILRYREPFVRWINEADPYILDPAITIGSDEQNVYLIHQIEHRDELDEWIALNHEVLFESELEGWYTDEALWPKNRTLELFNKWVHVEYHTVVIDVVDAPLLDDEAP